MKRRDANGGGANIHVDYVPVPDGAPVMLGAKPA